MVGLSIGSQRSTVNNRESGSLIDTSANLILSGVSFDLLLNKRATLNFSVGDVVEVVYEDFGGHWKVRKFVGICISVRNGGTRRIILRNVYSGIAVEMSFDLGASCVISCGVASKYKAVLKNSSKLKLLRNRRPSDSTVSI